MKSIRHFDSEGEISYDLKHDTLVFKAKNRNYKKSFEFQNFIIDIDEENYITGIRILDASKVSGANKFTLKNIVHGEFKATITDKHTVTVTFKFIANLRNKIIPLFSERQNFTQQVTTRIDPRQNISVVENPIIA